MTTRGSQGGVATFSGNRWRWQTAPEFGAPLCETLVSRLQELEPQQLQEPRAGNGDPAFRPLKVSRRRQVYLWHAPGLPPLVIKRYPPRTRFPESLRDWIQARGATEFQINCRLQELAIPCPAPVAALERMAGPRPAESYFVAVGLIGAVPLGPLLEARYRPGDDQPVKHELVLRAARTAALLHDHGLQHRDFHGGNLLLREAEGPAGCLYVIDSPRTIDRGVVGPAARARDLADLLYSLRHALSSEERRQLFTDASAGEVTPELLEQAYHTKMRRTQRSRAARAFVSSSRYHRHRDGSREFFHDRVLTPDAVAELCRQHDAAAADGAVSVLRYGSRSVLSVQATADELPVLIKEYPATRSGAARRATTAWSGGAALTARDIPTPRPLALVRAPGDGSSYLITDVVEGAVPLHLLASRGDRTGLRSAVARAVRDVLVRLIRHELVHTDLSPKNVLIVMRGETATASLVDWDAIRPNRRWTARSLARALAQVGDVPSDSFSRADRVRFVRDLLRDADVEWELAALLRDSSRRLSWRRRIEGDPR